MINPGIICGLAIFSTLFMNGVYATEVANYQFNDTLGSNTPGAPDLVDFASGSYVTDTVFGQSCRVFEFQNPSGFSLNTAGLISTDEYTFVATFYFEDDMAYKSIVNPQDVDNGFYTFGGFLTFYINANLGGTQPVTAFEYMQVAFTREADGTVTGYKNGVESFSYNDQGFTIISDDTLKIFRDNTSENPAGRVASMQFYDTALTAQQIATLKMSCLGGFDDSICYNTAALLIDGGSFSGAGTTIISSEVSIATEVPAITGVAVESPHILELHAPVVELGAFGVQAGSAPDTGAQLRVVTGPVVCP